MKTQKSKPKISTKKNSNRKTRISFQRILSMYGLLNTILCMEIPTQYSGNKLNFEKVVLYSSWKLFWWKIWIKAIHSYICLPMLNFGERGEQMDLASNENASSPQQTSPSKFPKGFCIIGKCPKFLLLLGISSGMPWIYILTEISW